MSRPPSLAQEADLEEPARNVWTPPQLQNFPVYRLPPPIKAPPPRLLAAARGGPRLPPPVEGMPVKAPPVKAPPVEHF